MSKGSRGRGIRRGRLALGAVAGIAVLLTAGIAAAKLKTISKQATFGAAGGTLSPKCPRGSEAVSGGFANPDFDPTASGGSQFLPIASRRKLRRSWKTSVVNEESESGTLVAYAYCDKHKPDLEARSQTVALDPEQLGSVTARCPSGSEAVAGGFASPDFIDPAAPGVLPVASKRTGERGWKATGYNTDTEPGRLRAFAYCDASEPNLRVKSS